MSTPIVLGPRCLTESRPLASDKSTFAKTVDEQLAPLKFVQTRFVQLRFAQGRAHHYPPGFIDRVNPNMVEQTGRRKQLALISEDLADEAHKQIAVNDREIPPPRSMPAWQRLRTDLVEVVTTWRKALEQSSNSEGGFGGADGAPMGLLTRRMRGSPLRAWRPFLSPRTDRR